MKEYVERVIAAHGGAEKFFLLMDERLRAFNEVWEQDSERIGRVLHAHLAVEHFMTDYIRVKNPGLGSLEDARLSFSQKISMLPTTDPAISPLKPGLMRLNKIRNRIAHNLKVDVLAEDRIALLGIAIFSAMRSEGAKRMGQPADDPLSVLEQFSKFAAGMLHSAASPNAQLWASALGDAAEQTNAADVRNGSAQDGQSTTLRG